jgi:hypothetical protein
MQIAIDTLADVNLKPNLGGSEQRAVSRTETAGNAGLSFSSADKARAILDQACQGRTRHRHKVGP